MNKYILDPEVAGQLGEKSVLNYSFTPPIIGKLHYEFDDWLGGDLLAGFRCFICTMQLATVLQDHKISGFELDNCMVSKSQLFDDLNKNGLDLPVFVWLKITGNTEEDFFIIDNGSLVVSQRALDVLKEFNLNHCTIGKFDT